MRTRQQCAQPTTSTLGATGTRYARRQKSPMQKAKVGNSPET
ncbi:MAG: hypothetical protein AB4426_07880 [Xenococcaceae cyanobacterium]